MDMKMRKWKCTFIRYNPQLNPYETTRIVEARTESSARKKAIKKHCDNCVYGSMSLVNVELDTELED